MASNYKNPQHIKDLRVNIRVSEVEYKRLEKIADIQGTRKATLARDAVIKLIAEYEAKYRATEEI